MSQPDSTANPAAANAAFGMAQQSLFAFQRMQEETARLHKQFLDNQQAALATLQALIGQQQAIMGGAPSQAYSPPATIPTYLPAPQPAIVVPMTPAPVAKPSLPTTTTGPDAGAILLAVVAEKTGYPADMLGLDMQLDADLGIDSIKRVEILSALQERLPNAPAVKPEHLGTLHTLRDIAGLLAGPMPVPTGPPITPPVPEAPRPFVAATTPALAESGREISPDELPPTPIPELPPTAYQTHSKIGVTAAPIFDGEASPPPSVLIPASASPPPEPPREVSAAADVVRSLVTVVPIDLTVERKRITTDRYAPVWLIAEPSSLTATVSRQFDAAGCRPQFIPWNDSPYAYEPKGLAGLVLIAPDGTCPDDLPVRAFRWLKRAAGALNESARNGGSFFATVTRLDGAFGFGNLDAARDPVQGALAGLSKTASHEWPLVNCKALDLDPATARNLAGPLVDEILLAGPLEVGLTAQGRSTLELVDRPPTISDSPPLPEGAVIVVSGGARGVTAESLMPLVRAVRPKLVILGRTPTSANEPEWLAKLADEAQIRQAILGRREKPGTPREINDEVKRLLAERQVRQNLRRFADARATVQYITADVQHAGALSAGLADIRRTFGPVSAIVHGAGVLADRKIEDLTDEQFTQVYSTKVVGLKNLLLATEDDPLRAVVLFSSSTGRFGRAGQVAYAAANEVLNKTAQHLKRKHPNCRTVALNWGPWEGGMVTPALAKVFAGEGVGLIPYAAGGDLLAAELQNPDRPAEVVVIARPRAESAPETPSKVGAAGPEMTVVFERTVSLFDHPVLRSHVLNDKAVLPLAIHAEWLSHAAMHGNPGRRYHGFNDLRLFQPVSVDELNPVHIEVLAGKAVATAAGFVVPVEIRSHKNDRAVTHSRADILLVEHLPAGEMVAALPETGPYTHTADEAYEYFLFHGPDLRALERVDGVSEAGLIAYAKAAPEPVCWMDHPVRNHWLGDPLAMDAAFQMMILWTSHQHRRGSLPCYVGEYRQYRRAFPADGLLIALRVTRDNGTMIRADIDMIDGEGRLVARLINVEHVMDAALAEAFRKGRLNQPTGHASRVGG